MEKVLGKKLPFRKEFKNTGETFSAHYNAVKFLTDKGYSVGSMQREAPIGILKGDILISKWRNLDEQDKKELNGVIIFDASPRNGNATIFLDEEIK